MRTSRLFGLDFVADSSIEELADVIERDGQTDSMQWRIVVTPNVDHLVHYQKFAEQRQVAESAYLVLPDGAPIVWASRLLGARLERRLAGSDFFAAWWRRIVSAKRPVFVIAANDALAKQLTNENPECRCLVPPMIDAADQGAIDRLVNEVLAASNSRRTDAIVIGLSTTKSHLIASGLAASAPPATGAPLLLLLGASAELYTGEQRRAPKLMRRTGTEWIFRLLSDPRRMAKRYLVDDLAFAPMVWREWRARRSNQR